MVRRCILCVWKLLGTNLQERFSCLSVTIYGQRREISGHRFTSTYFESDSSRILMFRNQTLLWWS